MQPEILSLCLPTCSAALISERGELAAARMQFATQQEPTVVQLLENLQQDRRGAAARIGPGL